MIGVLLTVAFTGTTVGAPSQLASRVCFPGSNASAPERGYIWTHTGPDGVARASTCGSSFDTLLYVRAVDCQGPEATRCDDDSPCPSGARTDLSEVSWPVTTGSTWCVVVDGYNGSSGPYILSIDAPEVPPQSACGFPPSFGISGAVCPPERLSIPCACNEPIVWDATPTAEWYEVRRDIPGTQTWVRAGDTRWRNRPIVADDEQTVIGWERPTYWIPAWDGWDSDLVGLPEEGVVYDYRVRACNAATGCGAYGADSFTKYAGAPWRCYEQGRRVACR